MPSALATLGRAESTVGSPSKRTSPAVDREVARQRLDQRRLAGAVVADQGDDLAGVDVEVGAVQGGHLAEPAGQPAGLEDRCGLGHGLLRVGREVFGPGARRSGDEDFHVTATDHSPLRLERREVAAADREIELIGASVPLSPSGR